MSGEGVSFLLSPEANVEARILMESGFRGKVSKT